MSSTYLTPKQLFLINGIIEGLVSIIAILSPKIIVNTKNLHKHGHVYAGFFGPMLFAMSFVCFLIIKLDDNNEGKHLFAVAWSIYHVGAAYNCFQQFMKGNRGLIAGLLFHTVMLASFLMYLKGNGFTPKQLLPF